MNRIQALSVALLKLSLLSSSLAQASSDHEPAKPEKEYSPYINIDFPQNAYFGDTHLHTSYSTDAGMVGNTTTPDMAYRVSKGEQITSPTGLQFKLKRPLDFVVISDHAENLGLAPFIGRSDPAVMESEQGKKWHDMVKAGDGYKAFLEWLVYGGNNDDPIKSKTMLRSAWTDIIEAAERHYEPGVFTTLHGFEWTSMPNGNNLHRNVIFRDGKDKVSQIVPMSSYDSQDPEDLWKYMQSYVDSTGGQVFAIPHNGNISNGLMFAPETLTSKKPLDADYAKRRQRWEPVYELTQAKGDGETHPLLSPDDQFADFETLDQGNLSGRVAKTPDMLKYEYAREALKMGLNYEKKLGTNPFQFGLIGSTDAHNGIPSTTEENNFSKANIVEPSPTRFEHVLVKGAVDDSLSITALDLGAAGLAGVWAKENTRESIWDAFARKEVFGTTGSRIRVRFFGGYDFVADDVFKPNAAQLGYQKGVPMGGELSKAPQGQAPSFMVFSVKDPEAANLDRIQIVKGWVDAKGNTQEKVFDVVLSDGREPGSSNNKAPDVGSTVDIDDASYTNTIGEAVLAAVWTDPAFDAGQSAFYYARVIEIPTPRWTAYDQKAYGVKAPEGTPLTLQDRAYTSPIWYTP